MQSSAAMRCSTKPLQNATAKNSCGAKREKRLVAKNTLTTGRMVATARPTEKARIIQSLCSARLERRSRHPRREWARAAAGNEEPPTHSQERRARAQAQATGV